MPVHQVLALEAGVVGQAELPQRQFEMRLLGFVRVQADRHQDEVGEAVAQRQRIAAGLANFWVYPAMGVFEMLAFFPLVVVGFVWGRRGIFGDVNGNSRMLRGWAILAAVVIAAVGIPWGCAEIGALEPRWATGLNATNELAGMLTGPGILAAIALACRPLQSRIDASGTPSS